MTLRSSSISLKTNVKLGRRWREGGPPDRSSVAYQGCPYSWSRRGEQASVFIVTISPKAVWVWIKQSFKFSLMF